MFRILRGNRGQTEIPVAIVIAIFLAVVLIPVAYIMAIMGVNSVAITALEGDGYVVLAAGEYTNLLDTLQDIEDAATLAVGNAEDAVELSQIVLGKLLLYNENAASIFPDNCTNYVTLTAGTPADTLGDWAEVQDNAGSPVTLASKFATYDGYIREVTLYGWSKTEEIYIIEFGYGPNISTVTTVGRVMARSDWTYVLTLNSEAITHGSHIYYRCRAQTALAYVRANFKYYLVEA